MVFFLNLQPTMFISNMFISKLWFSLQEIDMTQDILFRCLICPCFVSFNNSQFEQILQIHAVSKKSLCLLNFWIREMSDKINCKCRMKNQTLKMQKRQLKMQSPIFIYLKRTNFSLYIFSRISRSLVNFAKLSKREILF